MHQIAIIGGGITGLSAAFYLQKEIQKHHLPIKFTLIEPSSHVGGKIQTVHHNEFVIERGPDSFLKRKKEAVDLIKEVGLEADLVTNHTGQSYILKGRELHPIPEDAVMGVPTRVGPFVASGLFTPVGKARAALDLIQPKSKTLGDQSVGGFFRRRLGNEVVDYLIEPLLSGIYASDIDALSLNATFPNFLQLEQKYRSLVLGMRTLRAPSGSKKTGQFYTLKRGLSSLVDAVQSHLPEESILLNTKVQNLYKRDSGYELELNNGQLLKADSVFMAIPYKNVKEILVGESLSSVREMDYTTVANVALAFSDDQIKIEQEGTGFVVSRKSDYQITACTWTNKKWPHTTPDGNVLLRCYVGRPGDKKIADMDDAQLIELVMKDLSKVMVIKGMPKFSVISRWKEAMPQYKVGHKEWVNEVKDVIEKDYPNVYSTGSNYDGVGIGDCIRQAKETIGKMLEELKSPVH